MGLTGSPSFLTGLVFLPHSLIRRKMMDTIAILLPVAIFIPFGLQMFFTPETCFYSPLICGIFKPGITMSPIAKLGTRFGGAYMCYVGFYGLITFCLGDAKQRKLWLLGHTLFTFVASWLVMDMMFNLPELLPFYTESPGLAFAQSQKVFFNAFGLFFFPLSLLGYL